MRYWRFRYVWLMSLWFLSFCGERLSNPAHQADPSLRSTQLLTDSRDRKTSLIFIVPGWGYSLSSSWGVAMEAYASWFAEFGAPRSHVYLLDYPYMAAPANVQHAIEQQMASILSSYPPDASFDLFGHSLGAFAGLYGTVEGPFAERLRQFVSLSGIPFGWNAYYCYTGICGKMDRLLVPFQSPFVTAFFNKNSEAISHFAKCSLYSPADGVIKPYDAGRFHDGRNIEVPDMEHLAIIKDKRFFYRMMEACYKNDLNFRS